MTYETIADCAIDYSRCRYGTSKLQFRGPAADTTQPFIACLGGTETFGRFVPRPFPELLQQQTGITTINLGYPSAGLDVFNEDATVLELARRAELRVVQVFGAQNLSNRLYRVHPRRNDRFVRPSRHLRVLFDGIDLTDVHFTGHLLSKLRAHASDRFDHVIDDLRIAWQARMEALLERIGTPTILLWLSTRRPEDGARAASDAPHFVSRSMLDALLGPGVRLTEVFLDPEAVRDTQGMVFGDFDIEAARGIPGPAQHHEIADRLIADFPAACTKARLGPHTR